MSKNEEQIDLFPVDPEITGLGITKFETKGADVFATVKGVTNVNDIALLTDQCWKIAASEWLLRLCGGDHLQAERMLYMAQQRVLEFEQPVTAKTTTAAN